MEMVDLTLAEQDEPRVTRIRRAPRVRISPRDPAVHIHFPDLWPERFQVCSLAELGAQFFTQHPALFAQSGQAVRALIQFAHKRLPVLARVVCADGNSAAVEFIDPPESFRDEVRSRFRIELKAASMTRFPFAPGGAESPESTEYDDGCGNHLRIELLGGRLLRLSCELEVVDLVFSWPEKSRAPRSHQKILMSFLRNLPGLGSATRASIERALALPGG